MREQVYQNSILASASISPKNENEDSHGVYDGRSFRAVFIADGLGSYINAALASSVVIKSLSAKMPEIEESGSISSENIADLFKQLKEELLNHPSGLRLNGVHNSAQGNLGTTLITVFETMDRFIIAYVGNGAIWHVRPGFDEFPSGYLFPWNACNYLNPHSVCENGKEALYRLISDNEELEECNPSLLEIKKDMLDGDIVMICTDGIFSADQVRSGRNNSGVWVKYPEQMIGFFEQLRHYFHNAGRYENQGLNTILLEYLDVVRATLTDDATLALLITPEALKYQGSKRSKS